MTSHSGYFCIPRSLYRDPLFKKLTSKQQRVFLTILDWTLFYPQQFDDHGVIIELLPGQLCATIREIVDWCEGDISKNDVERSVKKLILLRFLRQEVRHTKSIITITHKETYELIIRQSETRFETTLRQDRDKIETESNKGNKGNKGKNDKNIAQTDERFRKKDAISFCFQDWKFKDISEKDLDDWKKLYPSVVLQNEILSAEQWLKSNPTKAHSKKLWRKFLTGWFSRTNDKMINLEAYRSQKPSVDRRNRDSKGNPILNDIKDNLF